MRNNHNIVYLGLGSNLRLPSYKNAMKVIVKQRLEEFGTAGNASKILPLSLSTMSKHYSSGQLSQVIGK